MALVPLGPPDPSPPAARPRGIERGTRVGLLVAGVVAAVGVATLGADEVSRHLGALEAAVTALGPWGIPVVAGALALGTTVLLPESLLALVAGEALAPGPALLGVAIGYLAGAALQYAFGRHLLAARIEREVRARPTLAAVRDAVVLRGVGLQALVRLTPLDQALLSYTLSASGAPLRGFLLASVAHLPVLALYVYSGHLGRHLVRAAGGEAVEPGHGWIVFGRPEPARTRALRRPREGREHRSPR